MHLTSLPISFFRYRGRYSRVGRFRPAYQILSLILYELRTVFFANENGSLRRFTNAVFAHFIEYSDHLETHPFEILFDQIKIVSALAELLAVFIVYVGIFRVALKDVESYLRRTVGFAKAVLPNAENVVEIINESIVGKNVPVLIRRINVKNKNPAVVHEQSDPSEYLPHVVFVRRMVDAVESADRRVDGAEKIKLLHLLAKENRVGIFLQLFFLRNAEHIFRSVRADNFVSPLFKQKGHCSGTARQIKQNPLADAVFGKERTDIFASFFIVDVICQPIVIIGEITVASHVKSRL